MKRISVLVLATLLMAIQTGCQSGPFASFSNSFAGGLSNKEKVSGDDLAAYRQRLRPPMNAHPDYRSRSQPVYATQPLGYRRGNLPCTT